MTPLGIAESVLVGGTTGFLSGLLGVGGGFILVPLLTLLGLPIHTAIGTSLAFIVCAGLAGLVQHLRQGSIDPLIALMLTIPASLMAYMGAHFSGLLPPSRLYILFGLLIIGVLILFFRSPLRELSGPPVSPATVRRRFYKLCRHRVIAKTSYTYDVNMILGVLAGMLAGSVSGLFGVGGGFLMVPLMVSILHIPLRITIGTCLAFTVFPALSGALTHWQLGHVSLEYLLPLVVTGIASSQVGARLTVRMHPQRLKHVFLLLITGSALYMLLKGFVQWGQTLSS